MRRWLDVDECCSDERYQMVNWSGTVLDCNCLSAHRGVFQKSLGMPRNFHYRPLGTALKHRGIGGQQGLPLVVPPTVPTGGSIVEQDTPALQDFLGGELQHSLDLKNFRKQYVSNR